MTLETSAKTGVARPVPGMLDGERAAALRQAFDVEPRNRLAQNAVTRNPIDAVAVNRAVVTATDHTFSHLLDKWTVTDQKQSGRCWLFAGMNLFRVGSMEQMGLKDFEFSQTYLFFWDKFERANYFLEAMIETADRPVDDRVVAWLLSHPVDDGGQWSMFASLVKKYGLVPKAVMPETKSSENTTPMNRHLVQKLREGARDIRAQHEAGTSVDAMRETKDGVLDAIYRMLAIHLGTPPERFDWQWNDKDDMFHRDGEMTPQEFARKYVDIPFDDYVALVNDPRPGSPYGRTYTVEYLGNVVGGEPVRYLNVEVEVMKALAKRSIVERGEPVWMGCDVGKMMQRDEGIWDAEMFDYGALYGTDFDLDKSERLRYHQTFMTHAMLFTGVDVVGDTTRRWRVENSWGDKNGRKGFYVMNDSWFDEYMFEVAVRREDLPADLQAVLEQEPIVLPAWDPMGALAH
jgi:bleomycin hydrolase